MVRVASTHVIVGMRSAAEAWLSFGKLAASPQTLYGSLLTKMAGMRTCLAFATMQIGVTGWRRTSGLKSAG
jgi:hypothetical protein